MDKNNPFTQLAERMRDGDADARRQFLGEMESSLAFIVKHAAKRPAGASRVHQQVRNAAQRLAGVDQPLSAAQAPELARDLSRRMSAQLWSGGTDVFARTVV